MRKIILKWLLKGTKVGFTLDHNTLNNSSIDLTFRTYGNIVLDTKSLPLGARIVIIGTEETAQ